jgi:hypothetical protein
MGVRDDFLRRLRRTIGDQPTYLLAGAADFVAEQARRTLQDLPNTVTGWQERYRDAPMRAAGLLVGQAARITLRAGQVYDELTRRGRRVVDGEDAVQTETGAEAEEDEPFVREPFMPEPLHPPSGRSGRSGNATRSGARSRSASHPKGSTSGSRSSARRGKAASSGS